MTDLSPILPKIAKLVPRLASDADGEVVATVRAIDRALRSGGFDWHDLTAAMRPALPPPAAKPAPAPFLRPWQARASWCARVGAGSLSARERDFLRNIAGNLAVPSEKQAAWLDRIAGKLGEGAW